MSKEELELHIALNAHEWIDPEYLQYSKHRVCTICWLVQWKGFGTWLEEKSIKFIDEARRLAFNKMNRRKIMSVQTNLYVALCAPITEDLADEFDRFNEDAYSPAKPALSIIDDGMSGKYCYAGRVLIKSVDLVNNSPEFYGTGDDYVRDLPEVTEADKQEIVKLIKTNLKIDVNLADVKVRIFFHYS